MTIHCEDSKRRPVIHVMDAADVVCFWLESPVSEVPAVVYAVTYNPVAREAATEL